MTTRIKGRYWLARFPWPRQAADELAKALPLLAAWMATAAADDQLVAQVLCPEPDRGARASTLLLLSRAAPASQRLHCELGFCDRVAEADLLRRNGLGVLEAPMRRISEGDVLGLAVGQPLASGAPGDPLDDWMIRLRGFRFDSLEAAVPDAGDAVFEQRLVAPSVVRTDQDLNERVLLLTMRRIATRPASEQAGLELKLRTSAGTPVGDHGVLWALASEVGDFELTLDPETNADQSGRPLAPPTRAMAASGAAPWPLAAGPVRRVRRSATLKPSGFRFEDVELFGFRIDLLPGAQTEAALQQLLRGLNFHWPAGRGRHHAGVPLGFEYRVASLSVVIELLRYGRMYWQAADDVGSQPQALASYTSQHELLMRVLVGRVDGGSTQARDPAVFVPAIFVDNPWSKLIGRELQGFKKRLARFYAGDLPLSLAGYPAPSAGAGADQRRPLADVSRVCAVDWYDTQGGRPSAQDELLAIDLPLAARESAPWDGTGTALPMPRLAQWQQRNFEDELFRRGFAREVLDWGGLPQASIQAAPVDGRALPRAWLNGELMFSKLQVRQPDGVAVLRLGAPTRQTPTAWRQLKQLLPEGQVSLPTGDWYHGYGDFRLRICPGLA